MAWIVLTSIASLWMIGLWEFKRRQEKRRSLDRMIQTLPTAFQAGERLAHRTVSSLYIDVAAKAP